MRKVVRTVGESFTRKTLLPLLLHWSYGGLACRSISTNSAINRGIRRGKTGSSRDDVRSRNENHGRWRDQAQERRPVERHERVRRPNHQQQQDVQDIKASAMMKESRRTPRQKKYLSGGRRDQSLSSRTTQQEFDPDRYNKGRQSFNDYGRGLTKPRSRSNDDRPRISPRSDRMTGREDHASRHQSLEKSDIDPSFRQYRAPTSGDDPVSVTGSQARQQRASKEPLSIPYTTPASEFLYGTSVILAALRSGRRKMYKLYVYDGDNREAAARDASVQKLAGAAGVPVKPVKGDWLRLMDKMSTGRPHNVCYDLIPSC